VQRETGDTARSLGEQLSMLYVNDFAYDTPCPNSLKKGHRKKYILVNEGATGHSFGWMDIRVQKEMPVARRASWSPALFCRAWEYASEVWSERLLGEPPVAPLGFHSSEVAR
jgi:hypothetical protein